MTGHIIITDRVRTTAEIVGNAIMIEDGLITAVGSASTMPSRRRRTIVPGATLIPGLRDAHLHPVGYAALLEGTSLAGAADHTAIRHILRTRAEASPPGTPILGMRLDDQRLAERSLPDRAGLDAAVADRPVLIRRYCEHVAIANTAALLLAGIDAGTPDPTGGIIDRDASGNPTGVLRETAIELVTKRLGEANRVRPDRVTSALRGLATLGITSVGAMLHSGPGACTAPGDEVDTLLAAAPGLPIRVGAYITDDDPGSVLPTAERVSGGGERLRWLGVKRFADGSFGGHTAAMCSPFADRDTTGLLRLTELDTTIAAASLRAGGGVAIHAIGDLAVHETIDVFARFVADGIDPGRLRLEHASILLAEDIDRLGRLGVIVSVQPSFIGSEVGWLENRVGPARLQRTYPFRSLADRGVTLAGGSDCPVESPDPWVGMALARDRAGIVPEQGLSAVAAFAMYTTGAARALREPRPLSVGSPADFALVDRDPVTATPGELRRTEVIATYVDGEPVAVGGAGPIWPVTDSI